MMSHSENVQDLLKEHVDDPRLAKDILFRFAKTSPDEVAAALDIAQSTKFLRTYLSLIEEFFESNPAQAGRLFDKIALFSIHYDLDVRETSLYILGTAGIEGYFGHIRRAILDAPNPARSSCLSYLQYFPDALETEIVTLIIHVIETGDEGDKFCGIQALFRWDSPQALAAFSRFKREIASSDIQNLIRRLETSD